MMLTDFYVQKTGNSMWIPRSIVILAIIALIPTVSVGYAFNTVDIGFDRLAEELGEEVPTGASVSVCQVESKSGSAWMPNIALSEFGGKTISSESGDSEVTNHATTVGKYFYGNASSLSPGITDIAVFESNNWMQGGMIQFLQFSLPASSPYRITNHSWVASASDTGDLLRRVDWLIDTDESIQVAGVNNGSTINEILADSFNCIAVGRTDGGHASGTLAIDVIYTAKRTNPDIVVPTTATSYAAPVVSSAVALLVETGHELSFLSTDSVEKQTQNRMGYIIFNAERTEVIKAALMAGADRYTRNSEHGQITDYREKATYQSTNGLDHRYGAGQLNINNSYGIISAGEQNSLEDSFGEGGAIGTNGFDYDPHFGGSNGSNETASYTFTANDTDRLFSATLVWNLKNVAPYSFWYYIETSLYDLELILYDRTDGNTVIDLSNGDKDNTETVIATLTPGHEYMIQVLPGQGQSSFDWDYALAWQMRADIDGDRVPDDLDDFPDNCDECADVDEDCMGDYFEQCIIDADENDAFITVDDVLPEDDFDGDAITNLNEFINGSDPTIPDIIPLDGDINSDCVVNMADLSILSSNWARTGKNEADLNGDQIVNMADLSILSTNWGKICQ
jgi:hypothetical protein